MNLLALSKMKQTFYDILHNSPVNLAYLFGSYADGTHTKDSDIDIALVTKEAFDKLTMFRKEIKIAAQLDKRLNNSFDVRFINDAPLEVKGNIVTHGKLLYCSDEDFRISFETRVRMRYFDYIPALRSMRETYFVSIKNGGLID